MTSSIRITFSGQNREFWPPAALRIGRSPDGDIILTNPCVSAHHGTLHHDGSVWVYTDTGSSNGTWIGQTRLVGPHAVRDHTTLGLGKVDDHAQLQLSVEGSEPGPRPNSGRHESVLALISTAAAVITGVVASLANLDPTFSGALVTATGGIPAGIGYYRSRDRRDKKRDLAQLRRGELRRPVPLVVVLVACSLLAWDSISGMLLLPLLAGNSLAFPLVLLVTWVGMFAISMYGGHYLGEHPYRWTAVAVLVMILARIVIVSVFDATSGEQPQLPQLLATIWVHIVTLGVAFAGVYFGRQRQATFIAAKASRLASEIDGGSRVG